MSDVVDNATLRAALKAQDEAGELQPGQAGWWRIWGSSVKDIRVGDAFAWRQPERDGKPAYTSDWHYAQEVEGSFPKFITCDGERFSLGLLTAVEVFRQDTHNILSPYCR
jgi:hypothetical protein